MIKDIVNSNKTIKPYSKEIEAFKKLFPSCFNGGGKESFDLDKFTQIIKGDIDISKESYGLNFLGKNYSKLIASLESDTVIQPDEEHNNQPENINSQNVYISGDNLDALKHLLKSYYGKIKCIYIDPPYNTGSDGFVYEDNFKLKKEELVNKLDISEDHAERILNITSKGSSSHSAWLMFMYPRLMLARDLLTDDGAILINIDDNEQANLKLICDDIFGEECFLGNFIWHKKLTGGYDNDNVNSQHDYILVYSKDNLFKVNLRAEECKYKNIDPKTGKKFKWDSLWNTGGLSYSKSLDYPIKAPDGTDILPIGERGVSFWLWSKDKVEREREELKFEKDTNGNWKVYKKVFQSDGLIPGTITLLDKMEVGGNTTATQEIKDLFDNVKVFDYPKPTKLIKTLIDRVVQDGDYVLDFFGGSSTTADAVMQYSCQQNYQNLHFILVQIQEKLYKEVNNTIIPAKTGAVTSAFNLGYRTIDQLGIDRIKRAACKIKKENSNTQVDLGFKHYTIKSINDNTIDKMLKFDPNALFVDKTIYESFGLNTVLTTWLVYDGYGFNTKFEEVKLDNYIAYKCKNHLYLIQPHIKEKDIVQLFDKYATDENFNPQNIVLFGYNFTFSQTENLKNNLKLIQASDKSLQINIQIRY